VCVKTANPGHSTTRFSTVSFAIATALLVRTTGQGIATANAAKSDLLLLFFASLGLTSNLRRLLREGPRRLRFLAALVAFLMVQDGLGVLLGSFAQRYVKRHGCARKRPKIRRFRRCSCPHLALRLPLGFRRGGSHRRRITPHQKGVVFRKPEELGTPEYQPDTCDLQR
jgi:hypothetical protein